MLWLWQRLVHSVAFLSNLHWRATNANTLAQATRSALPLSMLSYLHRLYNKNFIGRSAAVSFPCRRSWLSHSCLNRP